MSRLPPGSARLMVSARSDLCPFFTLALVLVPLFPFDPLQADMQGEVGHVQFDGCREDKQPASAIASPLSPSSLGSRLMTGISVMTGASSAHDQSSAADAGGNAETAAVGVGVENMDSDSEEGEGKGDEDEILQSPVKAAPRKLSHIAFQKCRRLARFLCI